MGELPLDEPGNGPRVVLLALKIHPQPSGLVLLGVPGVPLHALGSIGDSQYAMRRTAKSLSVAFKQVPEETDHDPGSLVEHVCQSTTSCSTLGHPSATPVENARIDRPPPHTEASNGRAAD